DMEHRKPKAVSSKLDPDKQAAFIKKYETLLNSIGDDEAVLFGDAVWRFGLLGWRQRNAEVHPTHAVRPVGCWGPKDVQIAVPQSSGRQRLKIHGAIDLETGKTRMIEAATVNAISMIMLLRSIEVMYPGKRLIHTVCGQRPLSSREAGASLAGTAGVPDQAALHPHLLPAPGSD